MQLCCSLCTLHAVVEVIKLRLRFRSSILSLPNSSGAPRSGLVSVPTPMEGFGALFSGFGRGFVHSIRPGALRFGVPQPERRKFFFWSDESMQFPSLWFAKIARFVETSLEIRDNTKLALIA